MVALFLRPDADQSDGAWLNESASATNLFNSVDEPTTPSDTDYIVSSTTDGDKVRLRLSDPSGGVVAPLIVRYRCKRTGTQAANLIGRLYQGTAPGTLITTFTQLSVSDTFTTYTYTLTSGEFTSITDFTDLYVEFELSQQSSLKVDLNFAAGVYYDSGTVADATGVLSCSRASTGYAKTSTGTLTSFSTNVLRITDLGLLVEDARTNMLLFSQDFSNAAWSKNRSSIGSSLTAPDGTTTALKIIEDSTTNTHEVVQNVSPTTFGTYTSSLYLKAAERTKALMLMSDGSSGNIQYLVDLGAATITFDSNTGSWTGNSATIETLASGWYRATITATSHAGTNTVAATQLCNASGAANYLGDGTSGLYLWGYQLENNSSASSYIPTTSAAATRAADNITTSGSLQTVINAATASLVAQTDNGLVAGVAANIVDSNGTNLLGFNASNNALASITATLATGNAGNRTTQDKLGLAWNASGRSLVLNGGTVATDATAQTPSATQHIGSSGSANFAYAYVERLTAFNAKLANATLQGFTV